MSVKLLFGLGAFFLFAAVSAVDLPQSPYHPLSDEFIDYINSIQSLWKAGRNFHKDLSMSYIRGLMGVDPEAGKPENRLDAMRHNVHTGIPENFDARTQWPDCPSIQEIRDQGSCGSCWAFGAVECMTDRQCIHSNGTNLFHYSAEDVLSCCTSCGSCRGGDPGAAWAYWVSNGIASGGNYGSKQGCMPYKFPECDHYMIGTKPKCQSSQYTPKCEKKCQSSYNSDYEQDKRYGKSAYSVDGEVKQIQTEIMKNGPVEAGFTVYEDFLHYKGGVYIHTTGGFMGGHAVRIIGWGVENGTPYWLIANSWNTEWGDKGYFKIRRGSNECDIETQINAGIPM